MSGRGSATRMDRLQNHVTGSLLLNMIENTAKLDKTTSSSSVLSEELNSLKTKVTQISGTADSALEKAQEAKDAVDSVLDAATEANAAKEAAQEAAQEAQKAAESLTNVVLKEPTEGQAIKKDLTLSDGVLTIGSEVVDQTLLTVNGQTDLYGNVTIGTSTDDPKKKLTVNGQITSGNVTIGKSSADADDEADLTVNGVIQSNGKVTVGTSTTPANLEVHGTITTSANSTIDPSIMTERTLTINGQGIKLTEGENNMLQLDKSPEGYARVWSEGTSLELKSNNNLLLEGYNINLDSMNINVDADMAIGKTDSPNELLVYGTIKTDNITATSGTITTTSNITMKKAEGDGSVMPTLQAPKIITQDIYYTSQPDNPLISLGVSDGVNNVIIGTSSAKASLEVKGIIRATDFSTTSEVSLSGLADNAVLKQPTGGADQAINGNLIASDFRCGDVSLKDLAKDVVLKDSSAQAINGALTIGSRVVEATLLTVNGNIESKGDVTIGTLADKADLTVYGNAIELNGVVTADNIAAKNIKSTGTITIGTSSSGTDDADEADLTVNGVTKLDGDVTIGTSPTGAGLEVHGDITSTGTIKTDTITATNTSIALNSPTQVNADMTIGTDSTGADLTVYGDITATDFTTTGGVSLSSLAGDAVLKSSTSTQEINGNLTLNGGLTIGSEVVDATCLMVNGNIESKGDVTIGTSTDNPKKKLTVNGNIESTGTITAGGVILGNDSSGIPTLKSSNILVQDIYYTSNVNTPLITLDSNGVKLGALDGRKTVGMYGNTSIGTDSTGADLEVHGGITSYGNITIGKSSPDADDAVLTVKGQTESDVGVTIGTSTVGSDLTVYGDIIAGEITATDFKYGDESLLTKLNGAVLKNPTDGAEQTINGNVIIGEGSTANLSVSGTITSNGKVTIGTDSTDVLLEVNGKTQLDGDVTIGVLPNTANLTLVNGQITAGNVTIGKSSPDAGADEADLTVNGTIQSNGKVTVGTSTTGANLEVYGPIITSTSINIGNLSISYNSTTGVVTFIDRILTKSHTIQLQ